MQNHMKKLTHKELLNKGLGVMDSTALSLCMDNNIPIHVFSLSEPDNVIKAVSVKIWYTDC